MSSTAYQQWLSAGKPYVLCRPAVDLLKVLRGAGYLVYHYPDDRHLQADTPEDHTPFSATGWPVESARWVGHALDVMPTPGLMPLPDLARRLIADRSAGKAGAATIKYVNWTDENGDCWHDKWQPLHVRSTSSDRGHIHISFRSDTDHDSVISESGYNPLIGGPVTSVWDEDAIPAPPDAPDRDTNPTWRSKMTLADIQLQSRNANRSLGSVNAKLDTLISRPSGGGSGDELVAAFIAALASHPEVVDALATAVAARVGMIPTAQQIAQQVGALNWHGTAGA